MKESQVSLSDEQWNHEELGPSEIVCDEAIDYLGFGCFQLMLLLIVGVCWASDAMEVVLLSFIVPVLKEKWHLSSTEEATLNAVIFSGMLFGASFFGWLSDKYGRKFGISCCLVLPSVFGIISAFSCNIWMLGICQFLVGFGVAGSTVPFSLFTEFLPSAQRGHLLIVIEVFWTFGTMLEAGLAWILLPEDPLRLKLFHGIGWRLLIGFSAVPMILALLCTPFLPESPRYLMIHGRTKECMETFKRMAWYNRTNMFEAELVKNKEQTALLKPDVQMSIQKEPVSLTKKLSTWLSSLPFLELFSKHLRVTTILTLALWFIGSLGYYGAIIMTPLYFNKMTKSKSSNGIFLEVFIVSCAELPGLLWATLIINLIGRKKTQSILFMSTGLFLILLALPSDMRNNWLMIIFAFGARGSIMGATCATWTYTPEVYPTSCRALALGICSSTARLGGMITPYIASVLIVISPKLPVAIYSGSCLIATVIALFLPFETMGRKLKDHIPDKNNF